MSDVKEFDLLIAGGGLAGTSIACALDSVGISTAIIESVAMDASSQPSFDDRAIALSWGSRRIFEGIGIWDAIATTATPINHIHISEKGRFGQAHLDAQEESVEALGYVALARDIGHALHQRMLDSKV
ncbi:2-octaprenyl-6-methoxyphenyl hydroxylase, partial [Solemya velum gill symbiont]